MELGFCPRCATPYTTSEVVGFGILRPREARAGGPLMEYACAGCGRRILLVPHGEGRYAAPGAPPPPAAPPEERLPPWLKAAPPAPGGAPAPGTPPGHVPAAEDTPPPEPERARPAAPPPPPPPPRRAAEPAPRGAALEESPLGVAEALRLLGLAAGADTHALERAFRERSRTCHPDKVAHLDVEFQELAERKFKRLQEAYDLLRGRA